MVAYRTALAGLALLGSVTGWPAISLAAGESGTAIAVVQATEATGPGGSRVLAPAAPVFTGDRIRTGASGEAQIRLRDDTRLVVGPNSSLLVDSFIYAGGNQANKVSLTAIKGAFRFITGSSPKDAYTISTPTATIGVRGTRFDFTVGPGGTLNFALFQGEARICDKARRCVRLTGACSVVVAPPNEPARAVTAIAERSRVLATAFPYVVSQARLRNDFRVDTSSCSVQRAGIDPSDAVSAGRAASAAPASPPVSPEITGSVRSNNGFGNGGEGGEGSAERGNPGQGNAGGNGNGGGNSNGNGGGNGNGNGRP